MKNLARLAGGLYLVNIVAGGFAIGVAPAARVGLVAHVITDLTNVPLAVIFYELFRVVDRRLALLVVFFTLVGTAVESASLVLPIASQTISYDVYTVYFGFYAITAGYLVLRSGFLPRTVGVLLAIDGLSYNFYSFSNLLAPAFASHLVPWVQVPILLGEGSFCLTLLVVGVNLPRWEARAAASARGRTAWMRGPAQKVAGHGVEEGAAPQSH